MRKVKTVIIDAEGRDKGKMFLVSEMPATQGARWSRHAFQALARIGVDLPQDVSGEAGIYMAGFRAIGMMPAHEADILLDELMTCVKIVRDTDHPEVGMTLLENDIEEIKTFTLLQMEVFELVTGFSMAGLKQKLTSTPAPTTSSE